MEALGAEDLNDGRTKESIVKIVPGHGDQGWLIIC